MSDTQLRSFLLPIARQLRAERIYKVTINLETEEVFVNDDFCIQFEQAVALFEEALEKGFIRGDNARMMQHEERWKNVSFSFRGLVFCEEWPIHGNENKDGAWQQNLWGQSAFPLLKKIAQNPEGRNDISLYVGTPEEERIAFRALRLLQESGYVNGRSSARHSGIPSLTPLGYSIVNANT